MADILNAEDKSILGMIFERVFNRRMTEELAGV